MTTHDHIYSYSRNAIIIIIICILDFNTYIGIKNTHLTKQAPLYKSLTTYDRKKMSEHPFTVARNKSEKKLMPQKTHNY